MRMSQRAVIGALIGLLLVAGTAFAANPNVIPAFAHSHGSDPSASAKPSEAPEASELAESSEAADASEAPQGSPAAAELARVLADLQAAGIPATADELQKLVAQVGVGGAVRVFAFAKASGQTPDEILALFESGKGWGEIAKELNLTVGPGIGGIMSQGHSQGHPHGH
jgi:hypothetical protein